MSKQYDADLYPSFCAVTPVFDEVIWLKDHIRISHEEREQFLNNEIENPLFTYRPQTQKVNYVEQIKAFNQQLSESKAPEVVIDLYRHKIEMHQYRNTLMVASLSGNDDEFYQASVELYGKPKSKYFSYVAKRVLDLCHKQKEAFPGSARRLRRIFSKISLDSIDVDVSVLPPTIAGGELLRTAAEVKHIFNEVLERCGIEGWTISVDETGKKSRFAVNPYSRTVFIPADEQLVTRPKPLTDVHVWALAEHEIGVHVRRGYEASKGRLRLMETGLDSYLAGEEGLGGYVQQQVEGADEFYGFDRYLAACLAVGMDGEERDFRAVFSLMTDYYQLKFAHTDNGEAAPFRAAWDVCVRIFRGSTGQTAGRIFTKDIVYMEGNIGLWHLLSERPHVFETLFIGKYNPLLPRHVQTLQTLEILKEW